jgi:hypothetical protein
VAKKLLARLCCWWRSAHLYRPVYQETHRRRGKRRFEYTCLCCGRPKFVRPKFHEQWLKDNLVSWLF